jgi:hypothetical protein
MPRALSNRPTPLVSTLLAGALCAAAPLAAQPAPAVASKEAGANADIVVQGTREELRSQLRQILDTNDGQLARFESQFCPKVIGFPADWTRHLESMIRANAVEAGIKVEPAGCRPTALVIFIEDPQRLVVELRKAMPSLFAGYTHQELGMLTAAKRPAYNWRTVEMVDKDGLKLATAGRINGEASDARIVRNANASRVTSNVRYDIMTSFSAIDIARTPGQTLRQLADYATMNLMLDLSRDAARKAQPESILALFEAPTAEAAPAKMSAMDKGALRGLYTQRSNNVSAAVQRGRMAKAMKQGEYKKQD